MTLLTTERPPTVRKPGPATRGSAQTALLVSVFFLLGFAVSAVWFQGVKRRSAPLETASLSSGAKTVLSDLKTPIEIRFYSLFDPASVPESTRAFADRIYHLLSRFEQQGDGKIKVMRHDLPSDASTDAASKDGIQAFNMDKGDACFLGLAIESKERMESLPRLSPEWEAAVEFDVARAIARAAAPKPAPRSPTADNSPLNPTVVEETKRALPEIGSLSVEEGTTILREKALAEFKKAASELEAQVKSAQQRLSEAQKGKSAAEQEAAMRELQQAQVAQSEKLKEIAAKAQAQIEALKQLKAADR